MKWLVALAIIVGLLWLGSDRVLDLVDAGRESARGLTAPIYGLSNTIEQTRARVEETNRKIEALAGRAAATSAPAPPHGSAAAYGAQARRDLQALDP